jgi:hypothetical protein
MLAPKKKLLIILGAGSSLAQGMPSVAEDRPAVVGGGPPVPALNTSMKEWAREWSARTGYQNYFETAWNAIDQYYHSSNRSMNPEQQPHVTFEKVLGDMLGLAHWMEPPPLGNALRQITCANAVPPDLVFPFYDEENRYAATAAIMEQLTYLLQRLAKDMRDRCKRIDVTAPHFQSYKQLTGGLLSKFDVGIYNLNCDNVVVRAWPEAFTGFVPGCAFDPRNVHKRAEWGFVYHLHGSVHHTLERESGSSIRWATDLASSFFDGHQGLATDRRSEGKPFPMSTLIAGGFKLDQLLVEPFQSFYATLVRHVHEADAILVGGYGFGDPHINRALQNRMKSAAERGDPRPPLAILDWSKSKDPSVFRYDSWNSHMSNTLSTNESFFHNSGNPASSLESKLVHKGFRVNPIHRVAIWIDGFIEAATHLDLILPWFDKD